MSGGPLDPTDPLSQFAAGLAKGTLQWTADTIRKYVSLINAGQLAFIGNPDRIAEVKACRSSPEYQFYRNFLNDKRLRLLALIGLTLRDYQRDPIKAADLHLLRERIKSKYGDEGLHIAQIVQSGILAELIPPVISKPGDSAAAARRIEAFLNLSEHVCLFVQDKDPIDKKVKSIESYLLGTRPPLFVMFARGRARSTLQEIFHILNKHGIPYDHATKELDESLLLILLSHSITDRD